MMNITLKAEQEEFIQAEIKKGQTTDGEEVFARLQEKLRRDFGVEG